MSAPPPELGVALAALAGRRPLLVASDYDGVLAPLADVPSEAVPEPGTGEVLERLSAVPGVTVALVSGRGLADLRATSGFTGELRWIGSHGAEFDGPLAGDLAGRRDELTARLEPLVTGTPGARLEIKPASVAVHVRQVPDRSAAAALLERARAAVDPSLTMKPGKDVFEVAVTDADKGSAVRRLAAEIGARGVLYLGDDVTDEDAFRALGPDDVTVKVGDGETVAAHRVADPAAVRALLEQLADLLG
ncbi:trehalose 6-phosphatase [Blastococcus aurantiacus]|uniref:Trehalose 6-phosphate phosphatase n=1 Tax=Blastococcus aurantiacus TaxID=1550231 RepID=A0A1G7QNW3_9ACTN|nr:trehalose-phosphatase [Blastococcus aurantiacus]SDG00216.1 trehalose 6-phosphatase [Blastococcus aurantiacus]